MPTDPSQPSPKPVPPHPTISAHTTVATTAECRDGRVLQTYAAMQRTRPRAARPPGALAFRPPPASHRHTSPTPGRISTRPGSPPPRNAPFTFMRPVTGPNLADKSSSGEALAIVGGGALLRDMLAKPYLRLGVNVSARLVTSNDFWYITSDASHWSSTGTPSWVSSLAPSRNRRVTRRS